MKDAMKHSSPDGPTSTARESSQAQAAWRSRQPRSVMAPSPSDARQAAGNFAVQRLLRTGAIQAKLNVGHPGDFYEREADRVAEEVMGAHVPQPLGPAMQAGRAEPGSLQRKCACEENQAQGGSCETCREKQLNIQRRPASSAGDSKGRPGLHGGASVHEVVRSAGRPLDSAARAFFEPRFGRDLSSVRIHSDASAGASAQSVNALAYTLGRDIVFGQGQYDSGSQEGRRLLAHELAHVVQQDFGAGLSDAVVQRQPDPQGQPAPDAQPDAPADPTAPIPLPPEHEDRVASLEEMAKDIADGEQTREELQAQVRNEVVGPATEEEQAQRDDLKAQLTSKEESIVAMLVERIALIDDALAALQQLLPGITPTPPKEPTASGEPAPDASVQSEIARLSQERLTDTSRLTLLKRCLARKRIKQIDAKLAALPPGPSQEAVDLEEDKQKQLDFLKTSAAGISCMKPPGKAHHPTDVSDAAFKKMKLGEGMIPIPYVALEGEKKGTGGCTIGYGHVITTQDKGRTCTHMEGPAPEKRFVKPGENVELGSHLFKHGSMILRKCDCTPGWIMDQPEAVAQAKKDIGWAIDWVKKTVHVDLDPGQFDALVDITLAVGSIPQSLLDVIHSKMCVDDEAVRQEYMKTALYTKDNKELGPIHGKRRRERVWGPKGDADPTCV
jgi:GH24 family phage-related lysozyme (muramidase)